MTTGDEPQLGGQDHDNAPMISGRGTKIIADARGAYLAGSFDGLFGAMTAEQQLIFRQAVIRQMRNLMYAEIEQAAVQQPFLAEALSEIDDWLCAPTPENQQRIEVRQISDSLDPQ